MYAKLGWGGVSVEADPASSLAIDEHLVDNSTISQPISGASAPHKALTRLAAKLKVSAPYTEAPPIEQMSFGSKRRRALSPTGSLKKRKDSVRGFQAITRHVNRAASSEKSTAVSSAGHMEVLSDDDIVCVMRRLLFIDDSSKGESYFRLVDQSRACVVCFSLSCRRIARVLRTVCPDLQAEALARASTRILPRNPFAINAFTEQMKDELLSCSQLKMLRHAQNALTCHCTKDCCRHAQRAFNKDVTRGKVFSRSPSPALGNIDPRKSRLLCVNTNCSSIAVSPDGMSAFSYAKERLSKLCIHGDARGKRFRECISRYAMTGSGDSRSFVCQETISVDTDDRSAPITMKASSCGKKLVFVQAMHEVAADSSTPFSTVSMWDSETEQIYDISPRQHGVEIGLGCYGNEYSVQDAWFTSAHGDEMLVVAWSTDFYHCSGHRMGSHAVSRIGPMYAFATYTLDAGCAPEFFEATFPQQGRLMTCSASSCGDKVLTLSKSDARRDICIHHVTRGTCKPILSGMLARGNGPICAALSPSADAIVAVPEPGNSVMATVHVANEEGSFSVSQCIDVSVWMRMGSPEDDDFDADLVKASLGIEFSPCGRFAALVDQHPKFGSFARNHGVVILDMAMRSDSNWALRPYPCFESVDQAPRGFVWSRSGVWLLPPGMYGSLEPSKSLHF